MGGAKRRLMNMGSLERLPMPSRFAKRGGQRGAMPEVKLFQINVNGGLKDEFVEIETEEN